MQNSSLKSPPRRSIAHRIRTKSVQHSILYILLLFFAQAPFVKAEKWQTYRNARFAYAVDFPAELLTELGESDSNDGIAFVNSDKGIQLRVRGAYNALDETIEQAFANAVAGNGLPRRKITYKVLEDTWFVVTGEESGRIFYYKWMLEADVWRKLQWSDHIPTE